MKSLQLSNLALAFAGSLLLLANCKKDEDAPYKFEAQTLDLPAQKFNYTNPDLPDHMLNTQSLLQQNVSDAGATLGRVLFYDPKLSVNNKVACASCHTQALGFADSKQFSDGFNGRKTLRNSSSIVNALEQTAFFWDARETDLEKMTLQPIKNHIEMGMDDFDALEAKLGSLDYYKPLFKDAFGSETVSREGIAAGLRQFLQSMVSGKARFDEAQPNGWGVDLPTNFSAKEVEGTNLFFGKALCVGCHNPSASSFGQASEWEDIGLEEVYEDKGVGAFSPTEVGRFKIPSLRNVAVSAPYMHDGRFATLLDVVNHYNENIKPSANLSWRLQSGSGPVKMNLTDGEKEALIAFLHTLTDEQFLRDERFSNPFK